MVKRRFLCSLLCCSPCCAFWRSWERIPDSWERMRYSPRSLLRFSGSLREISGSLPGMLVSQWGFFRKPTSPPLPLREGPPLSPSPFPLRGQGMCQPPYSVLKPLRYKVGGPSEVSPAAKLHFAVCDRMDTNRIGAADRPISP